MFFPKALFYADYLNLSKLIKIKYVSDNNLVNTYINLSELIRTYIFRNKPYITESKLYFQNDTIHSLLLFDRSIPYTHV